MNGKHYIGKRASSLELYDEIGPITGVALVVDDKNKCFAGDESGYVLTAECPYATDQMAADALAKVQGKTYLGYRSTDTVLPVDAELGDGVTVGGIYSLLAYRKVSFGPGHMSEISAPGENEVDHEYPYVSNTKRETDRKLAQTRSEITKTAKAITQRVEDVEGAMSKFTVSLESLSGRVEDAEGKAAEAKLTIDGFTVTDESGTTRISGSKVEASTLDASSVSASTLYGNKIILRDGPYSYQQPGHIMLTSASTADYAVEVHSDGALRLVADTGATWLEAGPSKLALSGSEANAIFHEKITPVNSGLFSIGDATFKWSAVYATTGTIQTSDRNAKHDIETLPEKYVQFVLWLAPKRFKLNDGTSGRYHVGFIAQDVEEGMALFGIDSLEFGGFVKASDEDGNDIYMLRYEEFIAIILAAVQKQQRVIDDHEERLKKLEAMMNG